MRLLVARSKRRGWLGAEVTEGAVEALSTPGPMDAQPVGPTRANASKVATNRAIPRSACTRVGACS